MSDINYLKTKCHIYITMTKSLITPYATDSTYNGDTKCRCKFCDKLIKNSDRLLAHERTCEITTFNILYKLQNGTLPKRPFTNTTNININNTTKPMNQIDIYENFCFSPKISQDTQTSNTFWENEKKNNNDIKSEIDNNYVMKFTIDNKSDTSETSDEELYYNSEVFDENEIDDPSVYEENVE